MLWLCCVFTCISLASCEESAITQSSKISHQTGVMVLVPRVLGHSWATRSARLEFWQGIADRFYSIKHNQL